MLPLSKGGGVTRVESPQAIPVQEQPWWTSGSRYALAFLVLSNVAVLLTIFVPELSHWQDRNLQESISRSEQTQQREIASANENLQSLNRQVEVTRLLFEHFFGRPAREQTAVVSYLRYQFPSDLRKKSLQAILVLEAKKPSVARQITQSVAAVQTRPVGQSKIDVAEAGERAGFEALIAGDLVRARAAFLRAYRAYPTYHNVDEIGRAVLADAGSYAAKPPAARRTTLRNTIGLILTTYGWGIPTDLRPRLERTFNRLT
jgi:hypothetical protein